MTCRVRGARPGRRSRLVARASQRQRGRDGRRVHPARQPARRGDRAPVRARPVGEGHGVRPSRAARGRPGHRRSCGRPQRRSSGRWRTRTCAAARRLRCSTGSTCRAAVREAIRARVEISTATPADKVGAVELAGVAAFSDAPSHGVAGGNQGLARALAAQLGDRLRLSSPVASARGGGRPARSSSPSPAPGRPRLRRSCPRGCATRSRRSAPATPRSSSSRCAPARRRAPCCRSPSASGPGPPAPATTSSRSCTRSPAHSGRSNGWASPTARSAGSPRSRICAPTCARPRGLPALDLVRRPVGARGLLGPRGGRPRSGAGGDDGPLVLAGERTAGPLAGLLEGALASGERAARQVLSD